VRSSPKEENGAYAPFSSLFFGRLAKEDRLRGRQDISPLFPREMGSVATFVRCAHHVIDTALGNVGRFGTVPEFVNAVENFRNPSPGTS
jgi:hypothetical protein